MTATYKWHEVYKAAVLETDWSRMDERIRAAELAIEERKNELALDHGGSPEEVEAITESLKSLSTLRTDVTSWFKNNARPG
jgi:hypothetical protein